MAEKQTGLQKLLVEEMQDLYDAEKQLTRALPKVAKAAKDEELAEAIREHLEVTKGHVERLEQAFKSMGMKARSKSCAGMEGIVSESSEAIQEKKDESMGVLDVAIIGGARRVEHYEIAAYTAVIDMARQLGEEDIATSLEDTLQEEQETDEKLSSIGKRILEEATSSEEEEEEGEKAAPRSTSKTRTAR